MNKRKFFSIITVCYNAEDTIEETIKSIVTQTDKDFEFILIDGLSTDNTLNIINKYNSFVTNIISEKDNGIYDAMNKGLQIASGNYVYFLNSGDRFINKNVLKKVHQNILDQSMQPSIVYGNLTTSDRNIIFSEYSNYNKLLTGTIGHQACFIKLIDHAQFDASLKIAADYKILLNLLFIQNKPSIYLDLTIAYYDTLKLDKTYKERIDYRIRTIKEKLKIIRESLNRFNFLKSSIYYHSRLVKYLLIARIKFH